MGCQHRCVAVYDIMSQSEITTDDVMSQSDLTKDESRFGAYDVQIVAAQSRSKSQTTKFPILLNNEIF